MPAPPICPPFRHLARILALPESRPDVESAPHPTALDAFGPARPAYVASGLNNRPTIVDVAGTGGRSGWESVMGRGPDRGD